MSKRVHSQALMGDQGGWRRFNSRVLKRLARSGDETGAPFSHSCGVTNGRTQMKTNENPQNTSSVASPF
jgi:hypothetical protein